ncbi:MAG: 1-acyl-sn-glycerol-3-phosphate acyltransferase [Planctomycetaceae bacterium]|nr:1-acyl-sn-glycerol-3-phosphate acyltransferase [Planctomycetaceae bacterium]
MNADAWGLLTLAVYLALAGGAIRHNMQRCPGEWQLWVLHVISRFFTPFFFRQHIAADCPLPAQGHALVISNHRSPIDPMMLYSGTQLKRGRNRIRRIEFLTAVEYCNLGGPLGFITHHMHAIPVARSGRDMGPVKEALRRLRDGKLVGVFPEGRINTGDGLLPANPGIAWLALHSRAPVYPAFIEGAPQLGDSMVAPFLSFSRVHLKMGAAIDLSSYYGRKINQQLLDEVTGVLMMRLALLGGVEYNAPAEAAPAPATADNTDGTSPAEPAPQAAEAAIARESRA